MIEKTIFGTGVFIDRDLYTPLDFQEDDDFSFPEILAMAWLALMTFGFAFFSTTWLMASVAGQQIVFPLLTVAVIAAFVL